MRLPEGVHSFWRGAWREGPWEGSRLSRLESVPSRGMSRGKREEGERGGAAAGRGSLMSVLCEYRTLFKVCVDTGECVFTLSLVLSINALQGEGGGVSVEFSLILCSS